ncbi:MAG: PrgI family protein [Patescibacteria group bacterium]|nr:MAG: PrgI family protein [Patescibacteria group bacterium]
MPQFVVPQFIDVEDKILGPITTRQFVILMVDGLVMFIVYKILSLPWAILTDVLLLTSGLVLAFVRINGQPFHYFLLNVLQTWRRPHVRVWNKELSDAEIIALSKVEPPPPPPAKPYKEALTTSRLSELALVVNTGGVYQPEE